MIRLTMDQFSNVQLAIDKAHTVSQRALDWRPGLIGRTSFLVLKKSV